MKDVARDLEGRDCRTGTWTTVSAPRLLRALDVLGLSYSLVKSQMAMIAPADEDLHPDTSVFGSTGENASAAASFSSTHSSIE